MIFLKQDGEKEFKRWHLVVLAIVVATAIFFRWYNGRWNSTQITINDKNYQVLVAKSLPQKIEGWSNKDNMGKYDGMIFDFPEGTLPIMVMRDMRFNLDILWVENGKIVDMAKDLTPENKGTPEADLFKYRPRLPATMVVELPAGFIEKNGLKIGDSVNLPRTP